MSHATKRLILSWGLAVLLHLLLPLAVWVLLLTTSRQEPEPPVTMVELISLPTETEPEKAEAVAEANHEAKSATPPDSASQPPPPPRAASAEPMATPRPVAKPPSPPKPPAPAPSSRPMARPLPVQSSAEPTALPVEQVPPDAEPAPPPEPEKPTPPPEPEKPVERPPPPRPAKPAPERPSRPAPRQAKELPATPLNLNPSVESLSRWDMNRRFRAQAADKEEEVVDLNTRQARYVSYFAQVKQRIEMAWIYPEEAKRDKLSGNVGVTFTIQRSGQLLEIRVTRSSEMAILDEAAVQAVQKAAPFAQFPDDWTLEKLTIRATFEYIRRGLTWQ